MNGDNASGNSGDPHVFVPQYFGYNASSVRMLGLRDSLRAFVNVLAIFPSSFSLEAATEVADELMWFTTESVEDMLHQLCELDIVVPPKERGGGFILDLSAKEACQTLLHTNFTSNKINTFEARARFHFVRYYTNILHLAGNMYVATSSRDGLSAFDTDRHNLVVLLGMVSQVTVDYLARFTEAACHSYQLLEQRLGLEEREKLYTDLTERIDDHFGGDSLQAAMVLTCVGNVLMETKRSKEAAEAFSLALTIRQGLLPENHADVMLSLENMAAALGGRGDYSDALDIYKRVVELKRGVLGAHHPDVVNLICKEAETYGQMRQLELSAERFSEALALVRQCYYEPGDNELRRKSSGNSSSRSIGGGGVDEGGIYSKLSLVLQALGRGEEAVEAAQRCVAATEQMLGPRHERVGTALHRLALLQSQLRLGEWSEALANAQRALQIRQQRLGGSHPLVVKTLCCVGELLSRGGGAHASEAVAVLRRATQLLRDAGDGESNQKDLASALLRLGALLNRSGDLPAAADAFGRALLLGEKSSSHFHAQQQQDGEATSSGANGGDGGRGGGRGGGGTGLEGEDVALQAHVGLARVLERQGFLEDSRQHSEIVVSTTRLLFGPHHDKTANASYNLGHLLRKMDLPAQAADLFRTSYTIYSREHEKKQQQQQQRGEGRSEGRGGESRGAGGGGVDTSPEAMMESCRVLLEDCEKRVGKQQQQQPQQQQQQQAPPSRGTNSSSRRSRSGSRSRGRGSRGRDEGGVGDVNRVRSGRSSSRSRTTRRRSSSQAAEERRDGGSADRDNARGRGSSVGGRSANTKRTRSSRGLGGFSFRRRRDGNTSKQSSSSGGKAYERSDRHATLDDDDGRRGGGVWERPPPVVVSTAPRRQATTNHYPPVVGGGIGRGSASSPSYHHPATAMAAPLAYDDAPSVSSPSRRPL